MATREVGRHVRQRPDAWSGTHLARETVVIVTEVHGDRISHEGALTNE